MRVLRPRVGISSLVSCGWQDAFDISDTQQAFVYWTRILKKGDVKKKDLPDWFKKTGASEGSELRALYRASQIPVMVSIMAR